MLYFLEKEKSMKIAIGADHGGYYYKSVIVEKLTADGHEVQDFGTHSENSCDYPEIAKPLAKAVAAGEFDRGILICGTGIGMSIAANKVPGARAALCSDTFSAHATREHNNSNILCLGERVIGIGLALDIVEVWLAANFSGDARHQRRIDMIEN